MLTTAHKLHKYSAGKRSCAPIGDLTAEYTVYLLCGIQTEACDDVAY